MFPIAGVQGEQGNTGAAGSVFSFTLVTLTARNLATPIEVFADAPETGTMTFIAQMSIDATAPCEVTMTPTIGGVSLTQFDAKATVLANKFLNMVVIGKAPIILGDAFEIVATFTAGTGTIDTGAVLYSID